MTFTLESLRTRARERADMVGSLFVSDTELDGYLQAANRELYYYLVQKYEKHFVYTWNFQHVAGDERKPLLLPNKVIAPAGFVDEDEDLIVNPGFFKLLTVACHDQIPDASLVGDAVPQDYEFTKDLIQLHPCSLEEESFFLNPRRTGRPTHYTLYGRFFARGFDEDLDTNTNQFYLQPYPLADRRYAFRVKYVPSCPDIPADDNVDVVGVPTDKPRHWNPYIVGVDEYVVVAAAVKMKDKEESDTSVLLLEKESIRAAAEGALTPIDAGMYEGVRQHRGPLVNGAGYVDRYLDELG